MHVVVNNTKSIDASTFRMVAKMFDFDQSTEYDKHIKLENSDPSVRELKEEIVDEIIDSWLRIGLVKLAD